MQVCIDLFITAQAYVDLATLRDLCHLTAGQLYHYCPFAPLLDSDQLTNDLRWNIVRPQVKASPPLSMSIVSFSEHGDRPHVILSLHVCQL